MRTTRRSRRDRMVAATAALAVNGLLVWALQMQLSPNDRQVDDDTSLQVVFVAQVPRPAIVITPVRRQTTQAQASRAPDRPLQVDARPGVASPELPAPPVPTRPMSAVYLQQARQWARQQAPVQLASSDALAGRASDLPGRATDRFRMAEPRSVADVVDAIGQAFGNGPHPCIRNRQDVAAYATGGDELALQMALDVERQCRP